jgi:hypothetical protein
MISKKKKQQITKTVKNTTKKVYKGVKKYGPGIAAAAAYPLIGVAAGGVGVATGNPLLGSAVGMAGYSAYDKAVGKKDPIRKLMGKKASKYYKLGAQIGGGLAGSYLGSSYMASKAASTAASTIPSRTFITPSAPGLGTIAPVSTTAMRVQPAMASAVYKGGTLSGSYGMQKAIPVAMAFA